MFCPNCGSSIPDNLKYCNSCGERLTKESDQDGSPAKMLNDVLETLFWFAFAGLGALIGLVAVLLKQDVKAELVGVIVLAYLATIFGISFLLVRQVPKLIDAKLRRWESETNDHHLRQLEPRTTAQLVEHRDPVMSVTDHTTKALGKVPARER